MFDFILSRKSQEKNVYFGGNLKMVVLMQEIIYLRSLYNRC